MDKRTECLQTIENLKNILLNSANPNIGEFIKYAIDYINNPIFKYPNNLLLKELIDQIFKEANLKEEDQANRLSCIYKQLEQIEGDDKAALLKAVFLRNGLGVNKDLKEAISCIIQLANKGNPIAQTLLASAYYNGQGVEKDFGKEIELYEKAAAQGYATAQQNLAYIYKTGQGVEKDFGKAAELYKKAAMQGYNMAENNLGICYRFGEGVKKDHDQALYWFQKAAMQGHPIAQTNLGFYYYKGKSVQQDFSKAVELYEKAAMQGYDKAQLSLGLCYHYGEGVEKDHTKALYWYEKAAMQDYELAQSTLGFCYYKGEFVKQDYTKAVYWYQKAAVKGSLEAQIELADCYKDGKGVTQDYSKAIYWYSKAAAKIPENINLLDTNSLSSRETEDLVKSLRAISSLNKLYNQKQILPEHVSSFFDLFIEFYSNGYYNVDTILSFKNYIAKAYTHVLPELNNFMTQASDIIVNNHILIASNTVILASYINSLMNLWLTLEKKDISSSNDNNLEATKRKNQNGLSLKIPKEISMAIAQIFINDIRKNTDIDSEVYKTYISSPLYDNNVVKEVTKKYQEVLNTERAIGKLNNNQKITK